MPARGLRSASRLKAKIRQYGLDMCRGDGRPLRFSSRLLPGASLNECPASSRRPQPPANALLKTANAQAAAPSLQATSFQPASVRQYTSLSAPTLPSLPPRMIVSASVSRRSDGPGQIFTPTIDAQPVLRHPSDQDHDAGRFLVHLARVSSSSRPWHPGHARGRASIHESISLSSQPTARSPSGIGRGKLPDAIAA